MGNLLKKILSRQFGEIFLAVFGDVNLKRDYWQKDTAISVVSDETNANKINT